MTRGPDPRFGTTFLAGQGDPTRDITLISRVSRNLTGRGGSFSNLTGRAFSFLFIYITSFFSLYQRISSYQYEKM